MSSPKQRAIVVTRSYTPAPDACVRALEVLLKKAGSAARPEDDVKESDGYVATNHHSK